MARFRSRPPAALYVAGPFAMGYTEFYNFLIPLYGFLLGMSAGQIGMLVGARSLLAVFLSIHVGALMDRLGTRRVALFFVWTAMALAPIFPLLPWFWPLLLLQVVNGGALQFAWSGSQTFDRPIGRRRGRVSRAVQLLRAHRHDRSADDCRSGMGFRRCLALLRARLCLGRSADAGAAPRSPGANRRGRWSQSRPARAVACRRRAPPIAGLYAVLRTDDDPGGGDDDGNHLSAHRYQWRAELDLRRLSKRDRADRHIHRYPVRRDRDNQRSWLAVRRAGNAAR